MVASKKSFRKRRLKLTPPSEEAREVWRAAVYGAKGDYAFPGLPKPPAILNTVIIKEGDLYIAQCLDVDESSFGASPEEAVARLQEALQIHAEEKKIRSDANFTRIANAELVGTAELAM